MEASAEAWTLLQSKPKGACTYGNASLARKPNANQSSSSAIGAHFTVENRTRQPSEEFPGLPANRAVCVLQFLSLYKSLLLHQVPWEECSTACCYRIQFCHLTLVNHPFNSLWNFLSISSCIFLYKYFFRFSSTGKFWTLS